MLLFLQKNVFLLEKHALFATFCPKGCPRNSKLRFCQVQYCKICSLPGTPHLCRMHPCSPLHTLMFPVTCTHVPRYMHPCTPLHTLTHPVAYTPARLFLLRCMCFSCTILARFLHDSCMILARLLHDYFVNSPTTPGLQPRFPASPYTHKSVHST